MKFILLGVFCQLGVGIYLEVIHNQLKFGRYLTAMPHCSFQLPNPHLWK